MCFLLQKGMTLLDQTACKHTINLPKKNLNTIPDFFGSLLESTYLFFIYPLPIRPQSLKKIAVIYLSVLRQNTMKDSRVPFRLDIRNNFFIRKVFFYHEGGGTLLMLHPWKHSRSDWMGLWAMVSSWRSSWLLLGDWTRWLLRSLPSQTILWVYSYFQ